jgi:hypothetical protein
MAEEKKKKKGHKFHRVHIEHHHDGSHTAHYSHEDGASQDKKHAVGDLDSLHDSIEDHVGQPNDGEAEADGGDHGIPEPMASQAGLPPSPSAASPVPAPAPVPGA